MTFSDLTSEENLRASYAPRTTPSTRYRPSPQAPIPRVFEFAVVGAQHATSLLGKSSALLERSPAKFPKKDLNILIIYFLFFSLETQQIIDSILSFEIY